MSNDPYDKDSENESIIGVLQILLDFDIYATETISAFETVNPSHYCEIFFTV